jgi:folate-dependent phosphoribosylglycinamide formyltransferase PurN
VTSPDPVRDVGPLRVVVLTCGELGIEVANALARGAGVTVVAVMAAPWPVRQMSVRMKVQHVIRTKGWRGLLGVAIAKLLPTPTPSPAAAAASLEPGIPYNRVSDFHATDSLEAVRRLKPDIGVLAGTYILRQSVFAIPRLGSINLHTGKAPEYRGATPAFWELYNGESTVGITVHRVAEALDAGDVLRQELFPLDSAPAIDPMRYIESYRRDVLRPNGIRIIVEVVRAIAAGTATSVPQDHSKATTYRTPDFKAIQELRRRVRHRREKGA